MASGEIGWCHRTPVTGGWTFQFLKHSPIHKTFPLKTWLCCTFACPLAPMYPNLDREGAGWRTCHRFCGRYGRSEATMAPAELQFQGILKYKSTFWYAMRYCTYRCIWRWNVKPNPGNGKCTLHSCYPSKEYHEQLCVSGISAAPCLASYENHCASHWESWYERGGAPSKWSHM